jgi:hypothetical protein
VSRTSQGSPTPDIYGTRGEPTRWDTVKPKTLQQGFDIERRGLNLVQDLFAAIIIVLLLGILAH